MTLYFCDKQYISFTVYYNITEMDTKCDHNATNNLTHHCLHLCHDRAGQVTSLLSQNALVRHWVRSFSMARAGPGPVS